MIDSIKGFLHVYKDTTDKTAIAKSISYHFCEAYESMIGRIIISKIELVREKYFIFLKES